MSRPRRGWGQVVAVAVLCLGSVLAGGLYALFRTPSWYTLPVIVVADRQDVRRSLVDAEQAFTEGLRAGAPFTFHILQDNLNRWVTMRREIYPLIDELVPHELADPLVFFGEGVITIAGRYDTGLTEVILSVDIVPTVADDTLVLRAQTVRCGSVRVPVDFGGIGLERHVERERETTWPGSPGMRGDFLGGLRIESQAWWKNGGINYRVRDVRVEPGVLKLEILPLGPHWARSNQD